MRMRKKRNLESRLEDCMDITVTSPKELRGSWIERLYPDANSLNVEIGCGKGRFITETAKRNSDKLYIAIEREKSAIVTAMETAIRDGIENLFFIVVDAAELCEIFGYGEVDELYINFCDPWTSNKHAKRRLTHRNFLSLYQHILKPAGHLFLKTDNKDLFSFSIAEMTDFGLKLRGITEDLHSAGIPNIMTEYEEKFSSQGITICRVEAMFPEVKAAPLLLKEEKRVLYTTLGEFGREKLRFILPHEHIFAETGDAPDYAYRDADKDEVLNAVKGYIEEIKQKGVDCIAEPTPQGTGRRSDIVEYVSQTLNIPIILATGYYREPWVSEEIKTLSRDAIARNMINEITKEITGTSTKAGFIKVGVSNDGITECEEKIFKAACRASKVTGAAIASHTFRGKDMVRQLEMIIAFRVSPSRLIWVHASREEDTAYHLELAEAGCYLEFDTMWNEEQEKVCALNIKKLIDAGHLSRILISGDRGWYNPRFENGGEFRSFAYIPDKFIPRLKEAGVTQDEINRIFYENPFEAYAR
ncbi:MAG: tRNA (guanosine(46)-N7)-methyltransferase TrmB [Clostridiales bacterium]|nr:tRNA (guanosine(46)-N7)-methyltransferase TrmB [Clostridiales bacterium]